MLAVIIIISLNESSFHLGREKRGRRGGRERETEREGERVRKSERVRERV